MSYVSVVRFFPAGAAVDLLTDLVAYWRGDTLNDQIGTSHLTNNNGVTFVAGHLGDAFSLDGVNQYLSVADNAVLSLGAGVSFTASLWTAYDVLSTPDILMGKGTSAGTGGFIGNEYQLAPTPANNYGMSVGNGVTGTDLSSVTAVQIGWQWFAAWLDVTAGEIGVRVNAEAPVTASIAHTSYDSGSEFTLGRWPSFNGGYSECLMQHIGFWKNRVLTSVELDALYNGGVGFDPTA